MKQRTNTNWPTVMVAAIAAIVFMFAANSAAVTQDKYKVGDRVECDASHIGQFRKGTVVPYAADDSNQAEINGRYYRVLMDGSPPGSTAYVCQATHMRPFAEAALLKPQNEGDKQAQNQPNHANQTPNQLPEQPAKTTNTNKYGTREPRTCADTRAPARGAITAALAKEYFICQMEKVSGYDLHLVENVKVEVGGGRPYNPAGDINFSALDVKVPIYPIRGSYTKYQCQLLHSDPAETVLYNVGKNCDVAENRKATGVCYKTTFGDWRCSMFDTHQLGEDQRLHVAPPR